MLFLYDFLSYLLAKITRSNYFIENAYARTTLIPHQKTEGNSMKALKAIWSKEEYDKLTPDQKEEMALKLVLFFGLILFAGGLLFLWKIGFFDFDNFWGIDREKMSFFRYRRVRRNLHISSLLLCSPAIAGAVLMFMSFARLSLKKAMKKAMKDE